MDKADLGYIGLFFGLLIVVVIGCYGLALVLGSALHVFMWAYTGVW